MDRAKEFLSTISHEIRTPLTSIKGFSKTILDSYDNLNDGQKKKFIKIIYEQSQRLINLVENALTAANSEVSEDDFVFKKADVNLILNKSVELVKINSKDKNYITNLEKDLYIIADTDKLQQIFVNILDNAAKYSGGLNRIEIKTSAKNNKCQICIKNSGSFIEDKDKDKIFEKFYRTDSYLTSKTQGSGLGLYIVKCITEKMKGEIFVNSSKEPMYTEFVIEFPLFSIENFTKTVKETKVV